MDVGPMFVDMLEVLGVDDLVEAGASSEVPNFIKTDSKSTSSSTRRGSRGRKFKGKHLICCTDLWLDNCYTSLTEVSGQLFPCTRMVNTHANAEAWDLRTAKGTVLCFISKEHTLKIQHGCNAKISDVVCRGHYKGATLVIL